ncbi:MAG: hypothetical protein U9Q58_10130, partial [Pseudomonadota bacterium]|nr:hypothetical protein [Pseudomonadota bacterium]
HSIILIDKLGRQFHDVFFMHGLPFFNPFSVNESKKYTFFIRRNDRAFGLFQLKLRNRMIIQRI